MYRRHPKNDDLNGIAEVVQLFSPADCESLISLALQEEPIPASVFTADGMKVDKSIRSVTQFVMTEDKYPGLYHKIKQTFKMANSWRFQISNVPTIQVFRYTKGDHYVRHTDWSLNKKNRKLSMSVQLSVPEDYEGGDVVLFAGPEDLHIPTDIGMAAIWPSWTLHQVMPITSGERWCLVAWAEGEAFN